MHPPRGETACRGAIRSIFRTCSNFDAQGAARATPGTCTHVTLSVADAHAGEVAAPGTTRAAPDLEPVRAVRKGSTYSGRVLKIEMPWRWKFLAWPLRQRNHRFQCDCEQIVE